MEEIIKTKVCSCYHRELPVTEFHVCRRNADGLQGICKECRRKHNKERVLPSKKYLSSTVESELSKFTPRQLMKELSERGYTGSLKYVQEIDITRL